MVSVVTNPIVTPSVTLSVCRRTQLLTMILRLSPVRRNRVRMKVVTSIVPIGRVRKISVLVQLLLMRLIVMMRN